LADERHAGGRDVQQKLLLPLSSSSPSH